mgnify:CR=1 FL=1
MAFDNKATYYDAGGIELIEIIQAKLTTEQFKGWLLGNLIKYSGRANFKGSFDRDIEKVRIYSEKLLEIEEWLTNERKDNEGSMQSETCSDYIAHINSNESPPLEHYLT